MTTNADAMGRAIRPAIDGDLPRVIALLETSGLPTVGITAGVCDLIIAEEKDTVVGVVGIEPRGGRYALLRSAAVAETARGSGIGSALVARAIGDANARGIEALYLLTTTAENYFPRFGFARIGRDDVPEEIRSTEEFRDACPASATVMSLRLSETAVASAVISQTH